VEVEADAVDPGADSEFGDLDFEDAILEEEEMVEEVIPEEEACIGFLKRLMDQSSLLWKKALELNIIQIRLTLTTSLTSLAVKSVKC
jgi:hypothetical protein